MFNKTYLETIDPRASYYRLVHTDVTLSIIIHVIFYVFALFLVDFIFSLKLKKSVYEKLAIVLIFIMIHGYIGRLARSKYLYKELLNLYSNNNNNNNNREAIRLKTIEMINNAYFTWYFLG